jgi:acylphosphatase
MQSVKGWVRNLWDGRVEAVLEGEEEAVKRLVDFCRKGPPGARIKDASVTWEQPTGEFEDFEIG